MADDLKGASPDDLKARERELAAELARVRAERQRRRPKGRALEPRIGGSFAPPLTPEKLERYRELAGAASPRVRDAMLQLCEMAQAHQGLRRSKRKGSPHPSGRGQVVPLEAEAVEHLDPLVPWPDECDALAGVFERIDPRAEKETRDAAFHLLWYANELTRDREPIFNDALGDRLE